MYIEVVIPVNLNQRFTYKVEPHMGEVEVGGIVYVNFNGRDLHAVVVATHVTPNFKRIKAVHHIVNRQYFGGELFKVLNFASNYFVSSLGNTLFTALPPLYRNPMVKEASFALFTYTFAPQVEELLLKLLANKENNSELNLNTFIQNHYLANWQKEFALTAQEVGSLSKFKSLLDYYNQHFFLTLEQEAFAQLKQEFKELGITLPILRQLLNLLICELLRQYLVQEFALGHESQISLDPVLYAQLSDLSRNLPKINQNSKGFQFLLESKLVELKQQIIQSKRFNLLPYKARENSWFRQLKDLSLEQRRSQLINLDNKLVLNSQQQAAYAQVTENLGYTTYLLDGVTGSGKTEVYLQIIEHYLLQGKSCLVLVPEIGLTPQTVNRFKNRFNVKIHIIHSNVDDETKNQIIYECQKGQVGILIGTRSAIFMPMQNLGCIIIDEEHDSSYKQQNDFRYNARDIAILRASTLGIPIIMGSATPSFTSLHNLELGKFKHLVLTRRAQAKHENKTIILDIRKQDFIGVEDKRLLLNKAGITLSLWELMQEQLSQGNQVLLFLNRRGFAPQLVCDSCGYIFLCPECDRPLTYHRRRHELHCHYCGLRFSHLPDHCPQCNSSMLLPLGAGTEQIENLCGAMYNANKVIRIDRDTSKNAQALEENLYKAHTTKGAILIGTQMIAKGHHFSDVTLVALLNIDGLMLSNDYRAPERLAQLYVQVAGRAGRENKPGTVVLQTAMPHEKIYHDLITLSYFHFARVYLKARQSLAYPPYTSQAYIAIRHADNQIANYLISHLYSMLEQKVKAYSKEIYYSLSVHELGKQNNLHKYVLDFIIEDRQARSEILKQLNQDFLESEVYKKYRPVFYLDVDPYDLN